jgi:hypothetical protein
MAPSTLTVDCINAEQCKGRVTLRLMGQWVTTTAAGSNAIAPAYEVVAQTCICTYTEDDLEDLEQRSQLDRERF